MSHPLCQELVTLGVFRTKNILKIGNSSKKLVLILNWSNSISLKFNSIDILLSIMYN